MRLETPPATLASTTLVMAFCSALVTRIFVRNGEPVLAALTATLGVAATLIWFRCRPAVVVLLAGFGGVAGMTMHDAVQNGLAWHHANVLLGAAWTSYELLRWQAGLRDETKSITPDEA